MAEDTDNSVLALMGRLDQRTERLAEDVYDLQVRMTAVEDGLAGFDRRIDRLEQRVERIERRLESLDEQD